MMPSEILAKRQATVPSQEQNLQRTNTRNTKRATHCSVRANLFSNIVHLYGEETLKSTKLYEKLRRKKTTLLCDLHFLIRCRDDNVLPSFTKLSYHTQTKKTNAILNKARKSLLRDEIQRTRRQLATTEKDLLTLHLQLSNTLHGLVWTSTEQLVFFRTETDKDLKTARLNKKHQNLVKKNEQPSKTTPLDCDKVVHNISDYTLSINEKQVLSKGFNFAITPTTIPVEDIIAGVESTLDHVEPQKAEEIRQDVARILRTANKPEPNLSRAEQLALANLKKNDQITILPADKGNATVVMNTNDYKTKMREILQDPAYKIIQRDPTTYLEKTTKTKIQSLIPDKDKHKQLIPREKSSRCPKLYGLPKIHKAGVPMRPIVSAFNSPLQQLEKYLAASMQPFVESAPSFIRNSEHLIDIVNGLNLQTEDRLVSFDVKSLYPSIPVDEALDQIAMNEDIPAYIIQLAEHCLKNTYFSFDGQLYRQVDGAPMGSSLSPAVANLFMCYFEKALLNTAPLKPKVWLRYVDDILIVWPHGDAELNNFLNLANSKHHKIQFTIEMEEEGCLPFLDILLKRTTTGKLQHTVYRKPTHTNRYLNAKSHHHPSQIQSVANTLICRSHRIADDEHKEEELKSISETLRSNGYSNNTIRRALNQQQQPKHDTVEQDPPKAVTILPYIQGVTDRIGRILRRNDIKTAYKPFKTIRSMLGNPKDKCPLESHGVYKIPCGDCEKSYIGQTNRRIKARVEEHKLNIRNKTTTSALFQHHHQTGHKINFDGTKHLSTENHFKRRIIREAIEIEKEGEINNRNDALNLHQAWKNIIQERKNRESKRAAAPPRLVPTPVHQHQNVPVLNEHQQITVATTAADSPPQQTEPRHRYYLRQRNVNRQAPAALPQQPALRHRHVLCARRQGRGDDGESINSATRTAELSSFSDATESGPSGRPARGLRKRGSRERTEPTTALRDGRRREAS